MNLKRLEAIATGVLALVAGGAVLLLVSGMFWESLEQARRHQEVMGTVVAQEPTKVCRQTWRPNIWKKCDRWVMEKCPVVQYQPETGKPLKIKDCSLRFNLKESVYVTYDSRSPSDARTSQVEGTNYHWYPVFISAVQMAMGLLLLVLGVIKLQSGLRGTDNLD